MHEQSYVEWGEAIRGTLCQVCFFADCFRQLPRHYQELVLAISSESLETARLTVQEVDRVSSQHGSHFCSREGC